MTGDDMHLSDHRTRSEYGRTFCACLAFAVIALLLWGLIQAVVA